MSGETTVGSIVGFLRLDASQWNEELDRAEAKAGRLGHSDPKIKIEVNSAEIVAKLEAVSAAVSRMDKNQSRLTLNGNQSLKNLEKSYTSISPAATKAAESTRKVADETDKVDKSSRSAGRGTGMLVTAIATLGPALVPIAGATVALAAGFGGMGAAGVLAIVGVKDQMTKGTAVGLTYKSALDGAKTSVMGLAATAATNVLGPLQQAIAAMDQRLPSLNSEMGVLSTATGKAGASIVDGLLAAFVQLSPLMNTVATYAVNLAARFDTMMNGSGVKSFGDYCMSVFPQVMATVESLVGATVRLVASFAPLGGGVLSEVRLLADVINAIDPAVLTSVATAAGAVFIGFKSWQGLSGLATGFGSALEKVGASAATAAAGVRALEIASGIIGVALAGLSFVMTSMSTNTAAAQAATDNLTSALIASNGALNDNVRLAALKNAQDSGALDNARMLGISTQQVVDAYLGQAGALGDLSAQRDAALAKQRALVDAGKADASTMSDVEVAYLNLKNQLAAAGIQWDGTKIAVQQHNDALKQTSPTISAAATAMQNLASQYGTSAPIMQQVTDAQKKTADAAQAATVKMQLENNAAGLLKQSLDALSGKSLSLAQAQNSFDSSLSNMGDHITTTGKKVHFTTTSIQDMSTASVALRGQLLGQVSAAEQTAEAYGQMKGSSEAGRQKLADLRDQIIKNATAHGVDKKAVENYIDSVLKIPKSVPPTKIDVDKAVASQKVREFIGLINGVPQYRQVFISVGSNAAAAVASVRSALSSIGASVVAATAPKHKAAGGEITGPGTGTSDSIPAMLSNGEFVVNANAAQKHKGLLQQMNSNKFANGGMVGVPHFATGGAVDFQGISSILNAGAPANPAAAAATLHTLITQLSSLQMSAAKAGSSVSLAQQALIALERSGHRVAHTTGRGKNKRTTYTWSGPTALAIHTAEVRLTNARMTQSQATAKLAEQEAKIAAQRRALAAASTPLISREMSAASSRNRVTASFLSNLGLLNKMGYASLALQLMDMGGSDAETLAAQAVRMPSAAKALSAQFNTSAALNLRTQSLHDQLSAKVNAPTVSQVFHVQPTDPHAIAVEVARRYDMIGV